MEFIKNFIVLQYEMQFCCDLHMQKDGTGNMGQDYILLFFNRRKLDCTLTFTHSLERKIADDPVF